MEERELFDERRRSLLHADHPSESNTWLELRSLDVFLIVGEVEHSMVKRQPLRLGRLENLP